MDPLHHLLSCCHWKSYFSQYLLFCSQQDSRPICPIELSILSQKFVAFHSFRQLTASSLAFSNPKKSKIILFPRSMSLKALKFWLKSAKTPFFKKEKTEGFLTSLFSRKHQIMLVFRWQRLICVRFSGYSLQRLLSQQSILSHPPPPQDETNSLTEQERKNEAFHGKLPGTSGQLRFYDFGND